MFSSRSTSTARSCARVELTRTGSTRYATRLQPPCASADAVPVQRAFTHAFDEVFDLHDLSIDVITHHGLTDPLVAQRTLVHAGVDAADAEARWPEVAASMLRYAERHTADAGHGLEVLPGVAALLKALHERGAVVGLVTGNLTPLAWAKMEALSLAGLFTVPRFGGFGTDHADRGELVRIAGQRARALAPGIRSAWHVGDTPADVRAAAFGSARALGVCTGVFTQDELLAANSSATVLPDLSNVEGVLSLFESE